MGTDAAKSADVSRFLRPAFTSLLLLIVSGWFCAPLFAEMANLGVRDWDQHLFYYASFLKDIVQYGQLPLWNPWYCGGCVLFQNPQIPMISPAYVLALLMPFVAAMKVNILLHYFLTLVGFAIVAKTVFRVSNPVVFLCAGSLFIFNGFFSLQIAEGHTWILSAAYYPFIYLGFEHYLEHRRTESLVFAAAAFALIVFSGGIYTGPYLALYFVVYATLQSTIGRTLVPLKALAILATYTFLFSALKLVPVADYMLDYPRLAALRESIVFSVWPDIFFNREQRLFSSFEFPGKIWGWHEYGSYIGIGYAVLLTGAIVTVLSHLRAARNHARELTLVVCFFGFLILFAGDFAYFTPYSVLRRLPVFSSMHVSGRFLIVASFIAALLLLQLGRVAMSKFPQYRLVKAVAYCICAWLTFDLLSVNRTVLKDAFTIVPSTLNQYRTASADAYTVVNDLPRYGDSKSSMYAGLLNNRYVADCYEPLKPTRGFETDRSLIFSPDESVVISNVRFSPNRVIFDLQTSAAARVYLNQNYVRGWSVDNADFTIEEHSHKPSFVVTDGSYKDIAFKFIPKSVFWGAALSLIGVGAATSQLLKERRWISVDPLSTSTPA